MSDPQSTNPSTSNTSLFSPSEDKDSEQTFVSHDDDSVKDEPERVDLGNHEADPEYDPPTVNEKGELVDSKGEKVFTTVEESLKDGSMVLDEKGRMPGIYLDDLEEEAAEKRRERYEKAFEHSQANHNSVVERQVNVANSPLPPVTVTSRQETPLGDNNDEVVHDEPVREEEPVV